LPRTSRAASAALALSLLAAAPAVAQGPPPGRDAVAEAAKDALRAHPAEGRVGRDQGFATKDVLVDPDGTTHTRLRRTHKGLDVLGGDVVVHRGRAGDWRGASLTLRREPAVDRADARLSAEDAAARAGGPGRTLAGRPELVVEARPDGLPRLAWLVAATGTQPDGTPIDRRTTVDAVTGAVLVDEDLVQTAAGTGRSLYAGTVGLETTLAAGTFSLRDGRRGGTQTVDAQNRTNGRTSSFTDADNAWGDGTTGSRQSAAVDAHYGTAVTWDYFSSAHGRLGIRGDGAGSLNRVHWGRGYANAFWSDACGCMTFGDGDGRTFGPLVSLDVAGHEMSHGVTSATADLTYAGESGGLNEATSDIFGTLVEFHAANPSDAPDYLIGEEIAINRGPLRYMDQPSRDGRSADCYTPSVGTLDVHLSSGVGNHFFYLLAEGSGTSAHGTSRTCDGRTVSGIGTASAGRIWYRALTTYMTSATTYAGARTATVRAARDLFGAGSVEEQRTAATWTAVGVAAGA
jgi:Zn-dependent metalloprotease